MGPAFQATQVYEPQSIQMNSVMELSKNTSSKISLHSQPPLLNTYSEFLFCCCL